MTMAELKKEVAQSISGYRAAMDNWSRYGSLKSPRPELDDYVQRVMAAIDRFEREGEHG